MKPIRNKHYDVWPQRLPHSLSPPDTTLWANLDISHRRYAQRSAFVFFDRVMTYAKLFAEVEALAGWLHHVARVRAGDRVAVCFQNSPQFVIAYYAVLRCDGVVVPVNTMNKAIEIKHYITDPQTRVAIVASDIAAEWFAANEMLNDPDRLQHVIVGTYKDYFDDITAAPEAWRAWLTATTALPAYAAHWRDVMTASAVAAYAAPPSLSSAEELAVLPYTSGTTGLPKGCMHTHRTIMHNVISGAAWANATHEIVSLAVVPMFHITGMLYGLHAPIYLGSTSVLMPRWDRELAGALISKHRVTSWTMIPTMIVDLLASPSVESFDLTSINYIGGGGAAMPQAVAEKLFTQFGLRFIEGYGLTETAAPSHSNPPDSPKQQCLGVPYMSTTARVINPETFEECDVDEPGEIVVHGPQVFKGYWRNEVATRDAFIVIEDKSFFRTGDIGRVDSDGYFFIQDRLKRMINASGFKVWPAEVETLLYRHPAIQEACVIASRDVYRGETVKAVIVLRAANKNTTADSIIEWAHSAMAVYKAPRLIEFVDTLPKNASGKVMWRALQESENARSTSDVHQK
jgi:fatty-acyl-CoA synthase